MLNLHSSSEVTPEMLINPPAAAAPPASFQYFNLNSPAYSQNSPAISQAHPFGANAPEPDAESNVTFTSDPWLQAELKHISSIQPPPSPSSSSGGIS